MKTILLILTTVFVLPIFNAIEATAGELEALAGKWSADVTDGQGRSYKQVLEFTQSKFKFQAVREGETVLYAEGDVKAEALGPFKSARFYNIRGGRSASDLESVDDDRAVIYLREGNELNVAMNFDRSREEPPRAVKFKKMAQAAGAGGDSKTLVIDKIVMHKTPQAAEWYFCFEATIGQTTKRFNIPDKTYDGSEITLPTDLAVPNASSGQTCKFVMKLDDVAGDECTEEMDNKSTGSFTITDSGSQDFKPEDQWSYTIHWHLK